ncbi:hypothetical protein B566_EDAN002896 [Ephemera danica]|nr:hypothetical protein B566_EDAN002896 [Ephemera danica]
MPPTSEHLCSTCGRSFSRSDALKRHRERTACTVGPVAKAPHQCVWCKTVFSRRDALTRHQKGGCPVGRNAVTARRQPLGEIQNTVHRCELCEKTFTRKEHRDRHLAEKVCQRREGSAFQRREEPGPSSRPDGVEVQPVQGPSSRPDGVEVQPVPGPSSRLDGVEVTQTAFNGYLVTHTIPNNGNHKTVADFFNAMRPRMTGILEQELQAKNSLKVNIYLYCNFYKLPDEYDERNFKTKMRAIYYATSLEDFFDKSLLKLMQEIDDHEGKQSGWTQDEVKSIEVRVNKYQPLKASSYLALPKHIAGTHAVINPQNEDQQCFKWAILAEFVDNHANRIERLRPFEQSFNWTNINFPTSIKDVKKFEQGNNITVNVFALDDEGKVYPVRVAETEKVDHRDLLIIQDEDNTHYTYIKDFNRLVASQLTKHKGSVFVCKRCFTHYNEEEEKLIAHRELCSQKDAVRIRMPEAKVERNGQFTEPKAEFNRVQHQHKMPFVAYADFESILLSIQGADYNPAVSSTRATQLHEAMSFSVLIVSSIEDVGDVPLQPKVYRGKDAPLKFMEYMKDVSEKISKVYDRHIPIQMEDDDWCDFMLSTHCYLCNKAFNDDREKRQDHCHLTGKYRGAAHNHCNLNFQERKKLPVFFHNLSGYDSHFLVRELGFEVEDGSVEVIASNTERYITFSKMFGDLKVQFVDTLRFMPYSLDALVGFMDPKDFVHINNYFPADKLDLVKRKGVFCYEFVDSMEKLELDHLPLKKEFYSKLTECDITDEDYEHAKRVWVAFRCKNLGEYSDLYLLIDVFLLADVFENFRKMCLRDYKLDPAWYFTVPGLAWDAALRHTRVSLDLLTDVDMLLMFEKGIRGGITQVVTRYCEAEPGKVIKYFDANNLYGAAMSMPLPTGDFMWEDPAGLPDIMSMDDRGPRGYLLEVDVHYPRELHDRHKMLPFLCERLCPPGSTQPKLLTTLYDKEKYVVHYLTLKQAVKHGLVVTRIHRAISFSQSAWFKPYIEYNTELRKQGKTKFDLEFRKLMNNSPFGKSMENIRNRIKVEIVLKDKRLQRLVAQMDFKDRSIYRENVAAVHRALIELYMNKPIYVGQAILDISKTIMYDFLYDHLIPKFGDRVELLYMDTDSYMLAIKTEDYVGEMLPCLDYYDTSNLDETDPLYSEKNKKVLGKFKSEVGGDEIDSFVGLRPKCYSIKLSGGRVIKKAKGVNKRAVKIKMTHEQYFQCLTDQKNILVSFSRFQSKDHIIQTIFQRKIALSSICNKSHILPGGIRTLPYGHNPV